MSSTREVDGTDGNWGRWGPDDQRGAANFVDAAAVARAAGLIRLGKVVNLGIEIKTTGVPEYPARARPFHAMLLDGGDYAAGVTLPDGFKVADDWIGIGCHATTHVDALAHVWYGDSLYNGHSADRVRSYGATRCGIEHLGALITRGVLLDVARAKDVPHLEGGYEITPADLDDAALRQGVSIERGDCVLIRTGWWRVFADDPDEYYRSAPGVGDAGGRHLAAMEISGVGADTMAFEVATGPGTFEGGSRCPVAHRALIRDFGIYIFELLDLEELGEVGVSEFMFVAAPLRIVGGTGSPLSPLAVL
jgi:kynurenine formamidase